jgi:hypothetical protein
MHSKSFLLATAALGGLAQGAVIPRASIDHDAVVGFAQTIPSGTTGEVYLAYRPHLKVVNGCVPFPAVDAEGNTKYVTLPIAAIQSLIRSPIHYTITY